MKKIQKLIGIILVIMLISVQLIPIINVSAEETETLTITTYGENEDGIRSDLVINTATLTVNNVNNGDEFSAYKIIDTFYNKDTNEITYEFTNDFQAFLDQSTNETYKNMTVEDYYGLTSDNEDGSASTSVITTSTLNALVSNYTTYLRANSTITGIDMTTTDTTATAENVPAGAYLILPKTIVTQKNEVDVNLFDIVRNLYGVMVGNVVFTSTDNNWQLEDVAVLAKKHSNSYLSAVYANISILELVDIFGNSEAQIPSDFFMASQFSSTLKKKHVLISEFILPTFPTNAINKTFSVEIEFPDGVTFDTENLYEIVTDDNGDRMNKIVDNKIMSRNGEEIGYVNITDKKISFNIDSDLISEGSFPEFTPFIGIELNDKAIVGDDGNEIVVRVIVTDDPYVTNSTTTLNLSINITTYGLELTSFSEKDSEGNASLLKGAKYEVYTDSELTESSKLGEFTVGEDGMGRFTGVPSGTIYLKQIKAPTGYQLIKEPIAVEIATENALVGSEEGYYQVFTYNDAMWYLPTTGGIGTIIYTIVGLLIVAGSAFGIVYYRKRFSNV